jgi:hypothetical protein
MQGSILDILDILQKANMQNMQNNMQQYVNQSRIPASVEFINKASVCAAVCKSMCKLICEKYVRVYLGHLGHIAICRICKICCNMSQYTELHIGHIRTYFWACSSSQALAHPFFQPGGCLLPILHQKLNWNPAGTWGGGTEEGGSRTVHPEEVHRGQEEAGEVQVVQVDHLDLRHLKVRSLQEQHFQRKNANKEYNCPVCAVPMQPIVALALGPLHKKCRVSVEYF